MNTMNKTSAVSSHSVDNYLEGKWNIVQPKVGADIHLKSKTQLCIEKRSSLFKDIHTLTAKELKILPLNGNTKKLRLAIHCGSRLAVKNPGKEGQCIRITVDSWGENTCKYVSTKYQCAMIYEVNIKRSEGKECN